MNTQSLTEEQQAEIGRQWAEILGMRHDPSYPTRWQLTTGNKTDLGLFRTICGMVNEVTEPPIVKALVTYVSELNEKLIALGWSSVDEYREHCEADEAYPLAVAALALVRGEKS